MEANGVTAGELAGGGSGSCEGLLDIVHSGEEKRVWVTVHFDTVCKRINCHHMQEYRSESLRMTQDILPHLKKG